MAGSIWSLLERAVEHGEHPAVVDDPAAGAPPDDAPGAGATSYAAFHRRVGGRIERWREAGVRAGDRVAVLDRNTPAFLEAYFAAAGLGAVLVPLNHRLAVPELAAVLADARAHVLVADRAFEDRVERLPAAGAPLRATLWTDEHGARGQEPQVATVPEDALAHLYYTSGTTGRAKGVMLTHQNVVLHAEAAIAELGLTASDRWAHVAPLFHLADAWATFAITAVGGTHVVVREFEPARVLSAIERERVTVTNLVPTMLGRLVEHAPAAARDLSSMRLVLSGGAPIAPALVRRILATFGCEYVQTYGMTETSPYLTLSLLHPHLRALPAEERLRYAARTGRPFRGVELEVVDEAGVPVPPDDRTVGEIRVRGATVSPGYWDLPEETAASFRGGWLYTGDLAVVDREGYVDIVDRRKDMIVSGGENVYSTEVENALCEHPGVLEAAAFGVPDPTWGELVQAAVVARPGHVLDPEELARACRSRIAGYKVPRRIHLLDALPRTASGKVEKRRLRERFAAP